MKIQAGKEQKYAEYVAKNGDPYGAATVRYGEKWADLMEARMAEGATVADVAKQASFDANDDGITGFMYGCAAQGLAYFWEHGEELRRWHNLDVQIKDEGEKANESGGILNPAVLNLSTGE